MRAAKRLASEPAQNRLSSTEELLGVADFKLAQERFMLHSLKSISDMQHVHSGIGRAEGRDKGS